MRSQNCAYDSQWALEAKDCQRRSLKSHACSLWIDVHLRYLEESTNGVRSRASFSVLESLATIEAFVVTEVSTSEAVDDRSFVH